MSAWSWQPIQERLEAFLRVDRSGCWIWTGAKNRGGYGNVTLNGRRTGAHRAMYEVARGPIPDGLVIDHLCRNRGCINPYHLDAVTQRVNCRRGKGSITHCKRGHPLSGPNVTIGDKGERRCKACRAYLERERRRVRAQAHA